MRKCQLSSCVGVPGDSRAAAEKSLDRSMLTDATAERTAASTSSPRRRGQSLAQLALAWALRDERVTSLVIGASSVGQLDENIAALEGLDFTDDELREIDRYAVDSEVDLWADARAGGPLPRLRP